MTNQSITLKDLSFAYDDIHPILTGLSWDIQKGHIYSLLGKSGCGKSTLLRLIAGLETPDKGSVDIQTNTPPAFVFQEPALLPWASVYHNIKLPVSLGAASASTAEIESYISLLGLDGLEDRYPAQLSGGQKMRVSIARALTQKAEILLLDEPFAALDEPLRFELNDLLLSLQDRLKMTVIFVTHSVYEAAYLADAAVVLNMGKLQSILPLDHNRSLPSSKQRSSHQFADNAARIFRALEEA
ncbi:nitrate/sulfonate/bicarbonate ABC transporter ATP-binding protein [Kordiimonas sediminis]|uniref:Nitrate/sulfonate/bicarbonate ABC transporter ATP-binding protein n=1 Tax=Kordiimonas sediminis TaxID=1735581 RepID=A0A919AVM0_9PROT|nr:ABC transporter ATP-binding protein [Kordiimonas sediminis]GHF27782.1 nitrate/sulfonate/bicarbonate ABC transporter ATP-binding protein [Kordiimonas sediminis]